LNFCRSAGSGTFPTEIGLLTKLTSLVVLDNSGLRGTVPKELANLAQLEILYLDRNDLSGTLPEELSRATNLRK
jgi:Leucine-rich repeat (LRR) protein